VSPPASAPVAGAVLGAAGVALALGGILTLLAAAVLGALRYRRGECAQTPPGVPLGLLSAAAGCLLLLVRGRS
jgi:hypothetical protein